MKIKELRGKSSAELQNLLRELRADLSNTHMKVVSNQEKQISKVQQLRRDIARILTLLNDSNRHD